MKFVESYAYKVLNKKLLETSRSVQVPRIDTIKKVGIIWQKDQQKAFQYLHDYFTPAGVIVRNLILDLDNKEPASNSNSITAKDLNWMGIPKSANIEIFTKTNFDVLFSLIMEPGLVSDYITAVSSARFKVGCANGSKNYFDLNINIGTNHDAMFLVKQQIFYLGGLNKK